MNLISARVVEKQNILPPLSRRHARSLLGSQLIWLDCPEIAKEARPGQFVMVRCGGCTLPRPLSIHHVKNGQIALFFTVWEAGRGTIWLSQRKTGETIELLGPLGNGFSVSTASRNLLLVAGGIGIAPLYFLAQQAVSQGYSVRLLQGAHTASQLYPPALLPAGIDFITATEDGTAGIKGMITDFLPAYVSLTTQVFACGPLPMFRTMASQPSLTAGPVQVSLEMRMGCGVGVCFGCTVKTTNGLKQACQDGPVFALDEVVWDEVKC